MRRPDRYLWFLIPVVLLLMLIGKGSVIDIQLHDTYLVVSSLSMGLALSLFLGFLGYIYWLCRKRRLVRWMTVFHLVSTTAGILAGILFQQIGPDIMDPARPFGTLRDLTAIVISLSVFSQFVLIMNIAVGIFRRRLQ